MIDWETATKVFSPEKENYLRKIKKDLDQYPLAKDALLILAGFGIISLTIIMPKLTSVIAKEIRQRQRDRFKQRLKRFIQQKLITIKDDPSGTIVQITEDGLKKALQYKIETMQIKKPNRWDGFWRIVIFDVPEKKKHARNNFRRYLKKLGFYMLNLSVFVHPYPCFDEVEFLRQISDTGKEVTYITAQSIESSADLKSYFNL